MRPEERFEKIKKNNVLRNKFIKENDSFILSSAAKVSGKYVDRSCEEYSIALIAFNEAIERYSIDRGNFFAFAKVVIKSRLTDEQRRQRMSAVPFSQLQSEDEYGNIGDFEPIGAEDVISDGALEMMVLKEELEQYNISFFDLPKATPKSRKTKRETYRIVDCIIHDEELLLSVKTTGNVPASALVSKLSVSRKLMERHRKYIIAATIILSGEYPLAASYINGMKEV